MDDPQNFEGGGVESQLGGGGVGGPLGGGRAECRLDAGGVEGLADGSYAEAPLDDGCGEGRLDGSCAEAPLGDGGAEGRLDGGGAETRLDEGGVLERMRSDWNARAGEDAHYYVAFGRRDQDEEEFFATASDVVRDLESQLPRLRARDAALEIGCGPGRLLRPMSRHFGEIHGVDVSDEMVGIARERLRNTPSAHAHVGSGSSLEMFPDGKFDFVYSYAVFQHIPSGEVVFNYLREAFRVLRPGGVLRCQLNGLPAHTRQYDTWSGVRISPVEIAAFARETGFQLLALEQIWTQYMWITCRKPEGLALAAAGAPRIRNITNAVTGESAAPVTGPMASLSIWVENLPGGCDLNTLAVSADGRTCRMIYLGEPAHDGVWQVNVALPEGIRTGLIPVAVTLGGEALCEASWVRIIPAGPSVTRLVAISDGVNLISGNRVGSGTVKVTLAEAPAAEGFRVTVDGRPPSSTESFCIDPLLQKYEFNFHLPPGTRPGMHEVRVSLGRRQFAPQTIEVV